MRLVKKAARLCRCLCSSVRLQWQRGWRTGEPEGRAGVGRGRGRGGGHCDVVVAGGGIMGCASAYFLAQRVPPHSICIVERDPTYQQASTVLSVSSIRQQFSTPGNILMSLYSAHFLRQVPTLLRVEGKEPPDPQFHEGGYLFLASPEGVATLRESHDIQRSMGAAVELLGVEELERRYPWLNTEGVELASLGVRNEGWFDPWLLLSAFRKKLASLGVRFLHAEVTGVHVEHGAVRRVKLRHAETRLEEDLGCSFLVNTAGPWAARLALMAGVGDRTEADPALHVPLPVVPRRRCVFALHCPSEVAPPPGDCPLVVDFSGAYFRPEGGRGKFITGMTPPEHLDPDELGLEVDHSLFEDHIWPAIAHRVPAFESLKVQSAWAGYYEYNTLDQNGIIGAHPAVPNLVLANGFSGHGIQQAPAVGRAVSEVILDGKTHSIDLSAFGFERVINNRPLREKNVI